MNTRHLLAADIGGTNSRFALFRLDDAPDGLSLALVPGSKVVLPTAASGSFRELLESLRATAAPGGFSLLPGSASSGTGTPFALAALSLAVPGAVLGSGAAGFCRAPNIKWPLSAAEAIKAGGAPAVLLNDFAAQGLACLFPEIIGLHEVLPGSARPDSPAVVVGAGTGLGKAIILPDARVAAPGGPDRPADWTARNLSAAGCEPADKLFIPFGTLSGLCSRILPSEGGHAVFPFKGRCEAEFQEFMLKAAGRAEAIGDMVVSGHGLAALYAFHSGASSFPPPPEAASRLTGDSPVLEWLARFYGRACRNLVLETLALGGVFLSGGLLAHVPGLLGHPAFAGEFRSSESQAALLSGVPVWWAGNQDCGLWGAALHGLNLL